MPKFDFVPVSETILAAGILEAYPATVWRVPKGRSKIARRFNAGERRPNKVTSPEGTADLGALRDNVDDDGNNDVRAKMPDSVSPTKTSPVPSGLDASRSSHPALKRRAILNGPFGTGTSRSTIGHFVNEERHCVFNNLLWAELVSNSGFQRSLAPAILDDMVPKGRPIIARRFNAGERRPNEVASPEGTADLGALRDNVDDDGNNDVRAKMPDSVSPTKTSPVPSGLDASRSSHPALKRRAILNGPFGTGASRSTISHFVTEERHCVFNNLIWAEPAWNFDSQFIPPPTSPP